MREFNWMWTVFQIGVSLAIVLLIAVNDTGSKIVHLRDWGFGLMSSFFQFWSRRQSSA